jgi:hypothetical protein
MREFTQKIVEIWGDHGVDGGKMLNLYDFRQG